MKRPAFAPGDWKGVLDYIGSLEDRIERLENLNVDTITIDDDNGVTRCEFGAVTETGVYGLRIYTADPSDPDHLKHNLIG